MDEATKLAMDLLAALRRAGACVFIDPDPDPDEVPLLFVSPPARAVEWYGGDVEEAVETLYDELWVLVAREDCATVH